MNPYLQSSILGLLQGLTEFLPVSSTAHMEIAPQLLGWRDPGAAFSAVVQLGPSPPLRSQTGVEALAGTLQADALDDRRD